MALNFLDESVEQAKLSSIIFGAGKNSWSTLNPRESVAVFEYLEGGVRPLVKTAVGKHLVALEDARRAGYAPPPTPSPVPTDKSYSSREYSRDAFNG